MREGVNGHFNKMIVPDSETVEINSTFDYIENQIKNTPSKLISGRCIPPSSRNLGELVIPNFFACFLVFSWKFNLKNIRGRQVTN